MSITAVVPVRAGSTRLKNKNIRPFMGSNLLEIKIDQLKKTPGIDKIVVSTDSLIMLEIAHKKGVTAKRRPDEYCDEKTRTFNEVVHYVASNEVRTEIMMWTPCVCPLVGSERISQAIKTYVELVTKQKKFDSVVSAALVKEYIFSESGPANYDAENHVPSQFLPNWHRIINGFFISTRASMIERRYLYGTNPFLLEVDKSEAIDIDDEYDFKVAEFTYKNLLSAENRGRELLSIWFIIAMLSASLNLMQARRRE